MRKIEKFLFIIPNTRWFGKRCWTWFTPAVAALAPVLRRRGFEVDVVEANIDNLSREEVARRVRHAQPDAVGVTNMSLEYWRQAHLCAEIARQAAPEAVIILGGVHPTTMPERVLEDPNIDYVVLAEGEERLPRLLDAIENGKENPSQIDGVAWRDHSGAPVVNPPTAWIENLDALPMPDYKMFDWRRVMNSVQGAAGGIGTRRTPVAPVVTSRGCPFRCCFCAGWMAMGRKIRFRSPENVLREIDMLVGDFGVREIVFQDDEMYADRDRAVAIIEGIRDRGYDLIWKNSNLASWRMDRGLLELMKESGCYQITISPESGSERVLREIIHKPANNQNALDVSRWCKELDLELQADFVIGFPGETWEEIRQTTNFAEKLDADSVKFAIATPFPGTELARVAVERGHMPADFDFYRDDALGFAKGVIETDEFTIRELQMLRCFEWDRINFKTPEKIKRYARVNVLTLEELDEFRRQTRRRVGIHFVDQAADERREGDEAQAGGQRIAP